MVALGAIYNDVIVRGQERAHSIGGVCNNVCRHLAQAAVEVELLVMLEPGELGDRALSDYEGLSIHVAATRVAQSMGLFEVSIEDGGEPRIVSVEHPTASLPAEHLELLERRIGTAELLVVELGVQRELVDAALAISKRHGLRRLGLPTRVDTVEDWPALLTELDILILNRSEAAALLRAPAPLTPGQAQVALERFLEFGLDIAIITFDASGTAVAERGKPTEIIPAPQLEVVSTLGAGDALAAGTIAGIVRGRSAADAVREAMPRVQRVLRSVEAFPSSPNQVSSPP